ncbi:early nodulin-70-like [Prosopis cineraria]|uniref:early nodulin-70-like n=1 Tax=Prosopis cineraria TaxID=364024 RepID=UPI00240FB90F|nr:early nodulin-70-like [Prosopis cineraria]
MACGKVVRDQWCYSLEELVEMDRNGEHNKRDEWVRNPPDLPSPWLQLWNIAKHTCVPSRANHKSLFKHLLSLVYHFFPILDSLRHYNASKFKNDLLAGLTLASLTIPQSMGYATMAELNPKYGLYTSIIPPIIFSLLTSSREIVIGPVSVDSVLLSTMIRKLKDPHQDSAAYTRLVFTATFFTGIFQVSFGLFRLGFLVDYFSHATIVGFLAGAAVIIGLQQMKGLLGIKNFTNKTDVISVTKAVWTSVRDQWNYSSLILGSSFLAFILITRFLGRRHKKIFWLSTFAPLLSVIVSCLIVFRINADHQDKVEVLGKIDGSSFNPSSLYQLNFDSKLIASLVKIGFIVAIISLTEAIAVGRSFAALRGYNLDPNKEMVSLGLINIVGSFTSCYVATGSFSRTAVNYSCGAETMVSNIVMALTVMFSLKHLKMWLRSTPTAVLASMILSALPGIIDVKKAMHIWKVDKIDFLACAAAFFGIVFFSVEIGLLTAVIISFAKIILISIQPGIAIVGRLPGTDEFCDAEQYPMAVKIPGVLIVRVKSACLCFANSNLVKERIVRRIINDGGVEDPTAQSTFKYVVLDMSSLMNIDTAGIASLEELHISLASNGLRLAIANPRWQVIHKLRIAKFVSKIGERVFLSVGEAVEACLTAKMAPMYP